MNNEFKVENELDGNQLYNLMLIQYHFILDLTIH